MSAPMPAPSAAHATIVTSSMKPAAAALREGLFRELEQSVRHGGRSRTHRTMWHPFRGGGPTVPKSVVARASRIRWSKVWAQREITLRSRPRGFHLITGEVLAGLPEIERVGVGLLHLFLRHTSAALTLNENASPAVLRDLAAFFDRAVPEDAPYWTHTLEGPDDMPAHVKASLLGASVSVPVTDGRLALGTWQGVYLCEHRDRGGPRRLAATVTGEESG